MMPVATIEPGSVFEFQYDSIAKKKIICNVTLRLGGLKFQTVTSGGNSGGRGFDRHIYYSFAFSSTRS